MVTGQQRGQSSHVAVGKSVNIRAVLRVRPLLPGETGGKGQVIKIKSPTRVEFTSSTRRCDYDFDSVFGPDSTQRQFFNSAIAPVISQVLDGYNCTVLAYGFTNSGKTYTMEGEVPGDGDIVSEASGVIPRALTALFDAVSPDTTTIQISHLEVYNEVLTDLLADGFDQDPQHSENVLRLCNAGNSVIVGGLEEIPVESPAAAFALLRKSSQRRTVAETRCNQESSRSHCIFTVTVSRREITAGSETVRVGRLNLVDLAGAENVGRSGAVGKQGREAGSINRSLLALGRVINALVEGSTHIPYRDSRLTHILQDSLGGTAITTIIATVTPSATKAEETQSTLEYATLAKAVRNQPAVNTRVTDSGQVLRIQNEIAALKQKLRGIHARDNVAIVPQELYDTWAAQHERLGEMDSLLDQRAKEAAELVAKVDTEQDTLKSLRESIKQQRDELRRAQQLLNDERVVACHLEAAEATARKGVADRSAVLKRLLERRDLMESRVTEHQNHEESAVTELERVGLELSCAVQSIRARLDGALTSVKATDSRIEAIRHSCDELKQQGEEHSRSVGEAAQQIEAQVSSGRDTVAELSGRILKCCEDTAAELQKHTEEHTKRLEGHVTSAQQERVAIETQYRQMEKALNAEEESLQQHVESARHSIDQASSAVTAIVDGAMGLVQAQLDGLRTALDEQVRNAESADQNVAETLESFKQSVISAIDAEFEERMRNWPRLSEKTRTQGAATLLSATRSRDKACAEAQESVEQARTALSSVTAKVDDFVRATDSFNARIHESSESMGKSLGALFEGLDAAKTVVRSMAASAENDALSWKNGLSAALADGFKSSGDKWDAVEAFTSSAVEMSHQHQSDLSAKREEIAVEVNSIASSHQEVTAGMARALSSCDTADEISTRLRPGPNAILVPLKTAQVPSVIDRNSTEFTSLLDPLPDLPSRDELIARGPLKPFPQRVVQNNHPNSQKSSRVPRVSQVRQSRLVSIYALSGKRRAIQIRNRALITHKENTAQRGAPQSYFVLMPIAKLYDAVTTQWVLEDTQPGETPLNHLSAYYWCSSDIIRRVEDALHSGGEAETLYWVSKQPDADHNAPVVLQATPLGDDTWGVLMFTLYGCYSVVVPGDRIFGGMCKHKKISLAKVQKVAVQEMHHWSRTNGEEPPFRASGLAFFPLQMENEPRLATAAYKYREMAYQHTHCCKIGVLLQMNTQAQEIEMYRNSEHPAEYQHFLNWLGEEVSLQSYTGYRGGLDVKRGLTGPTSIVMRYRVEPTGDGDDAIPVAIRGELDEEDKATSFTGSDGSVGKLMEIMFHVGTLMPTTQEPLQLEKKRHIGNDSIVIVFQQTPDNIISSSSLTSEVMMELIAVWPSKVYFDDTPMEERRFCFRCVHRRGLVDSQPLFGEQPVPLNDETRAAFLSKILGCRTALWGKGGNLAKLIRARREILSAFATQE